MPRRARIFGRRKGKVDRAELVKSSFFSLLIIITTTEYYYYYYYFLFFFFFFLCLFLSSLVPSRYHETTRRATRARENKSARLARLRFLVESGSRRAWEDATESERYGLIRRVRVRCIVAECVCLLRFAASRGEGGMMWRCGGRWLTWYEDFGQGGALRSLQAYLIGTFSPPLSCRGHARKGAFFQAWSLDDAKSAICQGCQSLDVVTSRHYLLHTLLSCSINLGTARKVMYLRSFSI